MERSLLSARRVNEPMSASKGELARPGMFNSGFKKGYRHLARLVIDRDPLPEPRVLFLSSRL
jgi:hypothetical protein